MNDGREFNLDYVTPVDIVSLVRDEVSNIHLHHLTSVSKATKSTFYLVSLVLSLEYVKNDQQLQDYVREYYRNKLSETIESLQYMTNERGKRSSMFLPI